MYKHVRNYVILFTHFEMADLSEAKLKLVHDQSCPRLGSASEAGHEVDGSIQSYGFALKANRCNVF